MFGNPGTVEQGFLDALEDYPDMKYITDTAGDRRGGDGRRLRPRHAQQPTVVQLHSGVGLGNGIGMLYQAKRGHAPLVVIAGESGIATTRWTRRWPPTWSAMARPVTKWATRVVDPTVAPAGAAPRDQDRATPPMGPVFVCLPVDVLDAPDEEPVVPTSFPDTRVVPSADGRRDAPPSCSAAPSGRS